MPRIYRYLKDETTGDGIDNGVKPATVPWKTYSLKYTIRSNNTK